MQRQIPTKHTNLDMTNIDHVPSNGIQSGSSAMLYVFEDDEAVIKMTIRGRSPTMRHVSQTHRVALEWLFDRINLDPKIQIRYIDTKHQLADTLTKRNFTCDEWNNLLHLCDIIHFSYTCCAKNSSSISCPNTMAKRMQEQKEEERIVAKSKLFAMNLSSHFPASSSSAKSPIASKSPVTLTATGKPESKMRIKSKSDRGKSCRTRPCLGRDPVVVCHRVLRDIQVTLVRSALFRLHCARVLCCALFLCWSVLGQVFFLSRDDCSSYLPMGFVSVSF